MFTPYAAVTDSNTLYINQSNIPYAVIRLLLLSYYIKKKKKQFRLISLIYKRLPWVLTASWRVFKEIRNSDLQQENSKQSNKKELDYCTGQRRHLE